jgi:hypothetical protein
MRAVMSDIPVYYISAEACPDTEEGLRSEKTGIQDQDIFQVQADDCG